MSYDYLKRTYKVDPVPGQRARHQETNRFGTIAKERVGQSHYVMVLFDGDKHPLPCHPTALDYLGDDGGLTASAKALAAKMIGIDDCPVCGARFDQRDVGRNRIETLFTCSAIFFAEGGGEIVAAQVCPGPSYVAVDQLNKEWREAAQAVPK